MYLEPIISFSIILLLVRIFSPESVCSTFTSEKYVTCYRGTTPTGNLDPKFQCIGYKYSEYWNAKNELVKTRTLVYSEGSVINYNNYSLKNGERIDVIFFYFFLIFCYIGVYDVYQMVKHSDYGILGVFPFFMLTGFFMIFLNNYYKMIFPSCPK